MFILTPVNCDTSIQPSLTVEIMNTYNRKNSIIDMRTSYFLFSDYKENKIQESISLNANSIGDETSVIFNNILDVLNLSKIIFSNSKPLKDDFLETLNRTYSNQLSDTPTKL